MASRFQAIVDIVKQALPSGNNANTPKSTIERPLTESELRQLEQYEKVEKSRWQRITESAVPLSMFIAGLLLCALAQLIGVWAILGFLLVTASPIVLWQQRLERHLIDMTEELKKLRSLRR